LVKRNSKISWVLLLSFCLLIVASLVIPYQFETSFASNQNGEEETDPSSYRAIDLYTQKEPYSGRGPNQSSDAFAPQEEVELYAYVTYRDEPITGKIVAFQVYGPVNRFENLSFTRTAVTNEEGIASVSFRIIGPNGYPKGVVFGVWNVVAIVDIAEVTVNDTVSFLVGWIVELVKVETVDVNNISKTDFMKNESMYFRLTTKNIAMTDRIATLSIDVYDNFSFPLGSVIVEDERVPPGVTVFFIRELLIPKWATLGIGIVHANAYDVSPQLGEVPWCPQVSTTFSIVKVIARHDVAVINVVPSVTEVFSGQTVNISVVVVNEGDVKETFDVSCHYDSVLIEILTVENLSPQTEKTLTFSWRTCCVPPGNYTIRAEAEVVPEEIDVDDNTFSDGVVQVKPWAPASTVEYVLPRWLLALLFLLAVLIGICIVLLAGLGLWWTREREKEASKKQATTSIVNSREENPFKTTKTCSACGREFPEVYTFCPHCFTFHNKDY